MNEKRVYSLDVLRIIAAAMIVMHHYQQITGAYFAGKYNFRGYGVVVELFFFLSGFLAVKYLDRPLPGFVAFMKKKALRLLPLVAISSIAYEILLVMYNAVCGTEWVLGNEISVWGVVLNSLGIQCGWFFENPGVNNPTWYVSVLLLCYVWFWLIDRACRKWKLSYLYVWGGLVLVGVLVCVFDLKLPFLNYYAGRGYYAFFFGLIVARLFGKKEIGFNGSLCALGLLAGMIWGWRYVGTIPEWSRNCLFTFVFYPVLVLFTVSRPVKKLLGCKLFGVLGEATYDVYIWHVPLLLAMYVFFEKFGIHYNLDYYKCLWGFVTGAFLVGIVSHYLVDRPLQRWMNSR